jgi:OOP family OmpA-OmpF porin
LEGQVVELRGEVPSEAVRQQVIQDLSHAAGRTYSIKHALKVVVPEQVLIDQALANRTVEFEPGSAVLTPAGAKLLDDMAKALGQFKGRSFELVGHTDGHGARQSNLALSLARAEAVKAYLVSKGLLAQNLRTKGLGPDQPIANNATDEGRARNRRIDFKLVV